MGTTVQYSTLLQYITTQWPQLLSPLPTSSPTRLTAHILYSYSTSALEAAPLQSQRTHCYASPWYRVIHACCSLRIPTFSLCASSNTMPALDRSLNDGRIVSRVACEMCLMPGLLKFSAVIASVTGHDLSALISKRNMFVEFPRWQNE